MANIIAELKRRNVFKVATIYVVVSWLLLQVMDVVFPIFQIPLWASQLVVLLIGLGFPIAMVLAWAFDLTPEGIEWETSSAGEHVHTHAWDWVLGILLVVVIGILVTREIGNWGGSRVGDSGLADAGETVSVGVRSPAQSLDPGSDLMISVLNSIAVLPFENRSTDPNDRYFADGLADELLSLLGRIGELKVASRTSTAYFKDKGIDHATIASTLKVDNVLSGSVRRDGDRIRVFAALDEAESGRQLWSNQYDETLDSMLDIQTSIARSVAAAIVPVLSPESEEKIAAQPTISSGAYDFYLNGRGYLRQPAETATLESAVELFDRAIDLDPRFAQAYAGRCEANLGSYEFTRTSEYFESAEKSCHRALTLNASLWEVHLALGNLYRINGQLDKAILELEAAISQQPKAVNPYLELAKIYAAQNDLARAEETFLLAEKVESGYWGVHRAYGNFLYEQSRYSEAIERHQRVVDLAPDNGIGHDNLGNSYLALGNLDLAERAFNDSPLPSRWTYTNRGLVYYYKGEFPAAVSDQLKAIELARDEHRAWGRLADAYRFVPGSADEALAAYEMAIKLAERELLINPTDWDSVVRLGLYFVHTGRIEEAQAQIEKLFKLTSNSTAYYFASIVKQQLGDTEKMYEYLGQAVERGFSRALVASDPDLAELGLESRFRELVKGP